MFMYKYFSNNNVTPRPVHSRRQWPICHAHFTSLPAGHNRNDSGKMLQLRVDIDPRMMMLGLAYMSVCVCCNVCVLCAKKISVVAGKGLHDSVNYYYDHLRWLNSDREPQLTAAMKRVIWSECVSCGAAWPSAKPATYGAMKAIKLITCRIDAKLCGVVALKFNSIV